MPVQRTRGAAGDTTLIVTGAVFRLIWIIDRRATTETVTVIDGSTADRGITRRMPTAIDTGIGRAEQFSSGSDSIHCRAPGGEPGGWPNGFGCEGLSQVVAPIKKAPRFWGRGLVEVNIAWAIGATLPRTCSLISQWLSSS